MVPRDLPNFSAVLLQGTLGKFKELGEDQSIAQSNECF